MNTPQSGAIILLSARRWILKKHEGNEIMTHPKLLIGATVLALLAGGCAASQPSAVVAPTSQPIFSTVSPTIAPVEATEIPTDTPTAAPVVPTATATSTPLPVLSASGGGVIIFSSDRSGQPGIYLMNADGSDQQLMTDLENAAYPAFSPDGTQITYTSSAPLKGALNIHK